MELKGIFATERGVGFFFGGGPTSRCAFCTNGIA
jgi:hypothetical protein